MNRIFLQLFWSAVVVSTLNGAEFLKGSKVELIEDAPLSFKDAIWRMGKSGDQFNVILHQPGSHKVYLSARDAAGKEIAVSVAENQLRIATIVKEAPIARKALREAKIEDATLMALTNSGTGTGFLVQMNGICFVLTNFHVVASAKEIEFKNPTVKFTITGGSVDVADDRDLVRFPTESDTGLITESGY